MRSLPLLVLTFVAACGAAEPSDPDPPASTRILVDASRDGGAWWFPQAESFDSSADHQGKALADYLRARGYTVDELPRGTSVAPGLLGPYFLVIRAGYFAPPSYTAAELAEYRAFLAGGGVLWLVSDVHPSGDGLSGALGVNMTGAYFGVAATFASHQITEGVTTHSYEAGGSVISGPIPQDVAVLGWLDVERTLPIMGIKEHPTGRIFFIGDINGLEGVPQPLVSNLLEWTVSP